MDIESPMRKRPKGRTLTEFQPLKPAEQKLLDACVEGTVAQIAAQRPDQPTEQNVIRAGFIRFLTLGGDENAPVHEKGVQLEGVSIEDVLDLEGVKTCGGLSFAHCTFASKPNFFNAHVQGVLIFSGSKLPGLVGDGLVCTSGLSFCEGFIAEGEVGLIGAQIGGSLECSNGSFENSRSEALSADRIKVDGSVFLGPQFKAAGKVRLVGAQIGGNLECSYGSFKNFGDDALAADGAKVYGDVFLNKEFNAEGSVRLLGTQIGGNLECSNGNFKNPNGNALSADGIKVDGNVFLNNGLEAHGEVRLLRAQIGGNLECQRGRFNNQGKDALLAQSINVTGNVYLKEGFTAEGAVYLTGAQIGGNLDCEMGAFKSTGHDTLSANRLLVKGVFIFRRLKFTVEKVSLASAHVRKLLDDAEAWGNDLVLNGFTYDSIDDESATDAKTRLEWLDKQRISKSSKDGDGTGFTPQPWVQLRKVLREMGHNEEARQVAIAFENRKRHCGLVGQTPDHWNSARKWLYRNTLIFLHWLFGTTIRYGYRPLRLIYIALFVWLFCGGLFYIGDNNGVFAPSNPTVFQNRAYASCRPKPSGKGSWARCPQLPAEYAGFHPLVYSLNVLLPVVDLQQESTWGPITPKMVKTLGFPINLGFITQIIIWFEILFGWVASLLLIAVVSGLTKKDDE